MTIPIELKTRTRDGHTLIHQAEQTVVPGLAIYELPAEYLPPGFNTWRIVHVPSGAAIGSGPTRGNVLGACAYLAPLTDWTRPVDELRDPDVLSMVTVNWALHDAGCLIITPAKAAQQQGAAA